MKVDLMSFQKKKGKALYLQIYEKLRDDILKGYLRKDDQLPSIRACAKALQVSRTSIEHAYEKLCREGYVYAKAQSGYYVDVDEENASLREEILAMPSQRENRFIRYDFQSSSVDQSCFDMHIWKRYLMDVLNEKSVLASYGDVQGEAELRKSLQKYAYAQRGVLCGADQIVVGASFQSLLYTLCPLMDQVKRVGMIEPMFLHAKQVFEDYGFTVVPIEQTDEGLCMEELYRSKVHLLYVNTAAAGRKKVPLSASDRKRLLSWAASSNSYLLEDDHNGELRYERKKYPAMQGSDMGKHVVYIGSFSKLLLPAIRISYMVLPSKLQRIYEQKKSRYTPTASKLEQLALARYLADGHLERHIRRLIKHCHHKYQLLLKSLKQQFPKAEFLLYEASLQISMTAASHKRIDAWIQEAEKKNILLQKEGEDRLVLSFAGIQEKDIVQAVYELKSIYDSIQ